jgi:autotransporter adhesin
VGAGADVVVGAGAGVETGADVVVGVGGAATGTVTSVLAAGLAAGFLVTGILFELTTDFVEDIFNALVYYVSA